MEEVGKKKSDTEGESLRQDRRLTVVHRSSGRHKTTRHLFRIIQFLSIRFYLMALRTHHIKKRKVALTVLPAVREVIRQGIPKDGSNDVRYQRGRGCPGFYVAG